MTFYMRSLALVLLIGFWSCKSPDILLSTSFKSNSIAYEVKGRQGLLINQTLSFGSYKTSRIKRGWTKSYDIPFILRFQGSSEKLCFTQYTPDTLSAELFCIGKLKSIDYEIIDDYFGVPIKSENTFSGTLIINKKNRWDFIIYNPDAGYKNGDYSTHGFAIGNDGSKIEFKPVKRLEGQKTIVEMDNYGFELISDNKVIAAVSTLNKGRVWMSKDADRQKRLIISGLCNAILLKSNLGEDFKSNYSN